MNLVTTSQEMDMPLLRSLLTTSNPFNSTEEILKWIRRRNEEVSVTVKTIDFRDMAGWHFNGETGDLCHDSGKFFSIVGLDVFADSGRPQHWMQPIINQPEVGYLGIICKELDGVLYFLLQAKIEPGNVNCVQLSPTLQATRSNYTQVHGGKKPAYLDYFKNANSNSVILDQLQSEQGARFLRKRNRNIIIKVDEDIEVLEDFRWMTLGQIKRLMRTDNMVNMDTRTVLSGLRFEAREFMTLNPTALGEALLSSERVLSGVNSIDGILHRLSELKSKYQLVVNRCSLSDVTEWETRADEIARADRRFFRIIGADVEISNREVARWCQPLVQPMQEGLCVLFAKRIGGVLHFLMQAKVECGNFDVVELAPTIQCLTGDYKFPFGYVPRFLDEFLSGCAGKVIFDTRQSEEGGRFYHEQNRNVICLVNDVVSEVPPENFIWLTLGQIKEFLRFNNYLNIQVRSLISALEYL